MLKLLCGLCPKDVQGDSGIQEGQRALHVPQHADKVCRGPTEDYVPLPGFPRKRAFKAN